MSLETGRIKTVFLDIDGTVYFKGEPLPGADAVLEQLRAGGKTLRLFSNIDSQTPEEVAEELSASGLPVHPGEIFTPVRALEELLFKEGHARCQFLVSENLRRRLAGHAAPPGEVPDYVVLGDCRSCASYDNLNLAFRNLLQGASLLALQAGRYYLRADGPYLDTGGFVRLLEYASGKEARVLGKPSPDFFNLALADAGASADELLVVGDDVTTDIAGAREVGAQAVLVRTGKFHEDLLLGSAAQPDEVIASVADLPELLARRPAG
jgi:HAD superfamily hydrolase (TIGR01458 family)